MPRKSPYYYPKISRFLVSVLYHEARSRRIPMTELAERLLRQSLQGSKSWRTAEASLVREEAPPYGAGGAAKSRHSAAISSTGMPSPKSARAPWSAAAARAASQASHAPNSPTRASKGATLQRLSGNQNSPTLKEFQRA